MNPYSQESEAEQEARRAEDLEILRRARQKRPAPTIGYDKNRYDPGERIMAGAVMAVVIVCLLGVGGVVLLSVGQLLGLVH
jgi:hypothetical protein